MMGLPVNTVKTHLHRARASLRDCVLDEVRQTVDNEEDLASELEVLLAALGRATPGIVDEGATPGSA